jgi:hypothetical protein
MESLQVRTGKISLRILDDDGEERGIFRFNPEDVESAKQVFGLQAELQEKQPEFEKRIADAKTPEERIDVLGEVVDYFNGMIDNCFGDGSSHILFGGAKTLSMYEDFFNGIMPYYEKAAKKRTAKYRKSGK